MPRPSAIPGLTALPVKCDRLLASGEHASASIDLGQHTSKTIATLAHIRGDLASPKCTECQTAKQHRFADCVVLQGYMLGRCTNCHWAGSTVRQCIFLGEPALPPSRHKPESPLPPDRTSFDTCDQTSQRKTTRTIHKPTSSSRVIFPMHSPTSEPHIPDALAAFAPFKPGGYRRVKHWVENDYTWGDAWKDMTPDDPWLDIKNPSVTSEDRFITKEYHMLLRGEAVNLLGAEEEYLVDVTHCVFEDAQIRESRAAIQDIQQELDKLQARLDKEKSALKQQRADLKEELQWLDKAGGRLTIWHKDLATEMRSVLPKHQRLNMTIDEATRKLSDKLKSMPLYHKWNTGENISDVKSISTISSFVSNSALQDYWK